MTNFLPETLPYCSFIAPDLEESHVGVGIGTDVVDLTAAGLVNAGNLDQVLALGPAGWTELRASVVELIAGDAARRSVADVELLMPFTVADYVDFYASRHHATNVGRIFRPDGDPLTPNWDHLPIGYHGRAGTVVV